MNVVSTKTHRRGAMFEVLVATSAHIDHMKMSSRTRGDARSWAMAGACSVMASGGEADKSGRLLADAGAGKDFGQ
jgi:hypothetical protein